MKHRVRVLLYVSRCRGEMIFSGQKYTCVRALKRGKCSTRNQSDFYMQMKQCERCQTARKYTQCLMPIYCFKIILHKIVDRRRRFACSLRTRDENFCVYSQVLNTKKQYQLFTATSCE